MFTGQGGKRSLKRSVKQLEGKGLGGVKVQGLRTAAEASSVMKKRLSWMFPLLTIVYRFGRSRAGILSVVVIMLLAFISRTPALVAERRSLGHQGRFQKQVGGALDPPISEAEEDRQEEGPSWSARVLFQQDGCPYSISEQQAAHFLNSSEPGNAISVERFGAGRTGNRFESLSIVLSMGYCCRSRMVMLPRVDDVLPAESDGAFEAHQRFFSFSNATLQSDEYMRLRDDPETCVSNMELGVRDAFYLSDVSQKLLNCMNEVYVRGCERAYLGPALDKQIICPERDPAAQKGAGSLVINIRSGDIMKDVKGYYGKCGQPPLQLYLHAMHAKKWDTVTIVTWSKHEALLNPTYTMLEVMANTGALGPNVQLFRNRSIWEDLREMICADGLVAARSSLSFPMFALSRASVYVTPSTCGVGAFRREHHPKTKDLYDNTTLLLAEKPNAEVFGIDWDEVSPNYTVYQRWNASDSAQWMEMVSFGGIKGLQRCL